MQFEKLGVSGTPEEVRRVTRQNRMLKHALLLTLLLVAVIVMTAQSRAPSEPVQGRVVRSEGGGRFEIVNGTPGYARNIMLLDSETGNSWITCNGAGGATGWCSLPRWSVTSGAEKSPE